LLSTRPSSEPEVRRTKTRAALALWLAPILAAGLAASACGRVEITLQLRAGVNSDDERADTSELETLRVILADEDGEQNNVEFKMDREQQRSLPDIEVTKSKPFSIDVWGCTNVDACKEADRTFRGCQLVDLSQQEYGSKHPIPIDILDADDPLVTGCPPRTDFN
jgi:hypothetical protein